MGTTTIRPKKSHAIPKKKGLSLKERLSPPRSILLAAIPVVLSAFYLIVITPSLVPIPPEIKVPFPAATRFLEKVCMWCSENPWYSCLIGAGVLASGWVGLLFTKRYFIYLAIVLSLALGFTFLSISAPIDRLLNDVKESLPTDNRVPSHHQKK